MYRSDGRVLAFVLFFMHANNRDTYDECNVVGTYTAISTYAHHAE